LLGVMWAFIAEAVRPQPEEDPREVVGVR